VAEFTHVPLDESDFDIASNPNSLDNLQPVLGVRRSLFMEPQQEVVITEGPLVDNINKILKELSPYVEADGGSVTFVDIRNGWVRLSFEGACGSCVASAGTLLLIEEMVCTEMPELKGVESVQE